MKLTWFGGTTLRIHVGGRVLVVDANGAPDWVDRAELLSGADQVVALDGDLPTADARRWQPRKVGAMIDMDEGPAEVLVHRLGQTSLLIEAAGEPPLILATGEVPEVGRWGADAVVAIAGPEPERTALSVVNEIGPRLMAIAGSDADVERVISVVRDLLDGTGLLALEPAMALEV